MRVKRFVCRRCGDVRKEREDVENMSEYSEEDIPTRCDECKKLPLTPEERLLMAMFGETE